MNHKEKQNEILKEIEEVRTSKDIPHNLLAQDRLKELKQKANEHQAEVMKGCGNKVDYNGYCAYTSSQGKLRMCPTCKKIIDKYEEVGI